MTVISTLLRRLQKSRSLPPVARARARLQVALLEDRTVPATLIWDGDAGVGDVNWATAANWDLNQAPVSGDTLVFPAAAPQQTNNNDTTAGNDYILQFTGGSYTIGGNQITLNGLGISDATTTGPTTLSTPLDLASATTIDVDNAAEILTLSGVISGANNLTKTGAGTLILSGVNTYTGTTTVSAGTLSVAADNNLGTGALTLGAATLAVTGAATIDNDIALTGAATVNNTGAVTLSGIISGANNLAKTGAGVLTLSGVNTYTGTTTVSAGTLSVAADNNLGTGAVTLAAGTTLAVTGAVTVDNDIALSGAATVDNTGAVTLSGVISGSSTLTKIGAGTLTLTNVGNEANFSGTITATSGTLAVADDDALGSGALTFSGGFFTITGTTTVDNDIVLNVVATAINVSSGITATLSGVISETGGARALNKGNSGTLVLTGTNTYTGNTNLNGGTLSVAGDANLGSGTILFNQSAPTLLVTGTGTIDNLIALSVAGTIDNANAVTLSGVISGANNLTKAGAGVLTLSGANTYTGTTTVSAGTLSVTDDTNLGTGALDLAGGTTLSVTGTGVTVDNLVTLSGAATVDNANAVTLSGIISGANNLTKAGAGVLTLSGANTFTGTATVSAGTLTLSGNSAIADTVAVTVSTGATLNLGNDETIGSLAGAGNVTLGANFLTAGADNSNTTFSGVISGTGTLTKQGTGTFTLSGVNTYTGATTVSAGTLSVAADNNLGTGAVTLAAGTTLAVTGATTLDNDIALSGAATIDNAAAVTASGVISGANDLTKAGIGVLTLAGTNTYTGTTTVSAGTLLVTGSITGLGVLVASGGTLGGTGTVPAVTVNAGGTIAPGTSPGTLNTGDLVLTTGGTFSAEVNGTTPGTDYDQAVVMGTVDVTGATLTVTLGFAPVAGSSYILINNDLVDAVTGTFNGLAEGATFTTGGVTFTISYVGGTGNDVVVTVAPPTVSINNVTAAEGNTGGTSFTFTVTLSNPSSQTVTVDYATAAGTATAGTDFTAASGTVTFAPGETSKTVTITVTGDTEIESDEAFTVVLSNPTNTTIATGTGTGTVTNDDAATSTTVISIGGGGGAPGTVRPVDPVTGALGTPILAFAGFGGEIRVASGDINGDGQADTITGAGAGAPGGHVKVFAADGTLLRSFLAFDGFTGGVFVTSGDVNGDGFDDIIVSADAGATPHVKVFSGADGALIQSFFAYDAGFSGGVRVGTGDVNGDGFDDIITGTGAGSTAHVKAFSGTDGALIQSFFAYDAGFVGGVYVAAGDLNGDGFDDIITGTGPGSTAHVKVFSGTDASLIQSFFAYDTGFRGGVRVGVGSVNGSAAVLTGAGPGAGPHVKAFVNGSEVTSIFAGDPTFSGGVYVG